MTAVLKSFLTCSSPCISFCNPSPSVIVNIKAVRLSQSLFPGQQILQEFAIPIQDVDTVLTDISDENMTDIICANIDRADVCIVLSSVLETKCVVPIKRKRKRSDSVLWQKPLHQQKCQKGKVTTQTTPQKSSIKQRLRTDLGRSVGVTTATQLVWLTGLRAHLPTNRNSRCRANTLPGAS